MNILYENSGISALCLRGSFLKVFRRGFSVPSNRNKFSFKFYLDVSWMTPCIRFYSVVISHICIVLNICSLRTVFIVIIKCIIAFFHIFFLILFCFFDLVEKAVFMFVSRFFSRIIRKLNF